MRAVRCLLAILLFAAAFAPALAGSAQRKRMDCCPDGETMACCRNASGCTLESCDGRGALPAPVPLTFVLPVAAGPVPPYHSDLLPASPAAAAGRSVVERPDPPPRG